MPEIDAGRTTHAASARPDKRAQFTALGRAPGPTSGGGHALLNLYRKAQLEGIGRRNIMAREHVSRSVLCNLDGFNANVSGSPNSISNLHCANLKTHSYFV